MVGRAGRPGFSTPITHPGSIPDPIQGESYLVVGKKEREKAVALVQQPLPFVLSQMHPKNDGGKGLLKAVLEMYGLSLCSNIEHVRAYIRHTLLWFQARVQSPDSRAISARQYLLPGSVDTGKEAGFNRNVSGATTTCGAGSAALGGKEEGADETSAVLAVAGEAMGFLVEARALCAYSATAAPQGGTSGALSGGNSCCMIAQLRSDGRRNGLVIVSQSLSSSFLHIFIIDIRPFLSLYA